MNRSRFGSGIGSRVHALALFYVACALAFGGSGCMYWRAVGSATGSLFESPRKVEKVADPKRKDARLAVLWIGHSTALIQIDDKYILTDPVFTSTVGQLSKRVVEPGLDPKALPPLDAVLISHMHFDHLSLGSLDMIDKKVRQLLMPQGGLTYLTDFAFNALELRTWQPWEKDGLRITAVPVDHVGYRYGIDEAWMKHSFTGYVIQYHGITVYFGGDSGYDIRDFVTTRERFPAIDLALLPIAPIEPREFLREYHMDPAEALQAFFDLGARWMVPIHYDTFINSVDKPGDALRLLGEAEKKVGLGARKVVPLRVGEQHVFMKQGEEHHDLPPDEVAPPAHAPSSAPKPAETPREKEPASNIPDEDRLD
ncbi:Putative outer membrane protein [Labilithrix luteola]|uniref:Putative outer membrane protein n=1 Tax=Labilithrix luteola TaxID=1391654 RepID=A0A0K1Q5N3_9BACT|nr:MBL fold metallo-hydrolase [Labilithrix luteola]AKV01048.1 Putative outer membrane protein [Labilithrix luteola]